MLLYSTYLTFWFFFISNHFNFIRIDVMDSLPKPPRAHFQIIKGSRQQMALGERKCRLRRSNIVILEFSPGEWVSWWVTPWKATTTLCGSVGAVKVKLKSVCHLESFVALNLYAVFQVCNDSFVYICIWNTKWYASLKTSRISHPKSWNISKLFPSPHILSSLEVELGFQIINLKKIYIIYVL